MTVVPVRIRATIGEHTRGFGATLACALFLSALSACGSRPSPPVTSVSSGWTETGRASWYGPGFHGRRTASGEVYDMEAMTAAHKTLPFRTKVRVENLDNGRVTEVRINDRGPFVRGRIIDLSRAAARRIGMLGSGTARVRIAVVGGAEARAMTCVRLQLGAFAQRDNAESFARRLDGRGVPVFLADGADGLTRVFAGPYASVSAAERAQVTLGGMISSCA